VFEVIGYFGGETIDLPDTRLPTCRQNTTYNAAGRGCGFCVHFASDLMLPPLQCSYHTRGEGMLPGHPDHPPS
jgi:hypothetical protein